MKMSSPVFGSVIPCANHPHCEFGVLKIDGFFERWALGFVSHISNVVFRVIGLPVFSPVGTPCKPTFLKAFSNVVTSFLEFVLTASETNKQLVTLKNPSSVVGRPASKFTVFLVYDDVLDVFWGLGEGAGSRQKSDKDEKIKLHE
jgi:hypothetical protein